MADAKDELEGTEQPFVSHLIELRDRLVRALIAVAVVFGVLCLWPGPAGLYDMLAAPLVAHLPKGTTLIATNVISPFIVPLKITLMAAFLVALPVVLYQVWAFVAPGLYDLLAAPLVAHLPKGTTLIATNVISPFIVPLKITLMAAFLVALPVVLYQVWAFVAPGLYSHEKKLVLTLVISSTLLFVSGVAFCYYFVFGQVFAFIQGFAPKSITAAPDIEAYLSFVLTMFIAFGAKPWMKAKTWPNTK